MKRSFCAHPAQTQRGFSLFELLVVLAIMGILAGYAVSGLPRILSGNSVGDAARRLAGAGHEARQMAILQQRPWELTIDRDSGEYTIGPAGVLANLEDEASAAAEPSTAGGLGGESKDARMAVRVQLAREKRQSANVQTLKTERLWKAADAYTPEEDRALLSRYSLPEEVVLVGVHEGDREVDGTRLSVIFSGRGFAKPTTLWLDEVDAQEATARHTVYFPGIMVPEVALEFVLPDSMGKLHVAPPRSEEWTP